MSSTYNVKFEQFLNIDDSVINKPRKSWIGIMLFMYIQDHQSANSHSALFFVLGKYHHFFYNDAVTAILRDRDFTSMNELI